MSMGQELVADRRKTDAGDSVDHPEVLSLGRWDGASVQVEEVADGASGVYYIKPQSLQNSTSTG